MIGGFGFRFATHDNIWQNMIQYGSAMTHSALAIKCRVTERWVFPWTTEALHRHPCVYDIFNTDVEIGKHLVNYKNSWYPPMELTYPYPSAGSFCWR